MDGGTDRDEESSHERFKEVKVLAHGSGPVRVEEGNGYGRMSKSNTWGANAQLLTDDYELDGH